MIIPAASFPRLLGGGMDRSSFLRLCGVSPCQGHRQVLVDGDSPMTTSDLTGRIFIPFVAGRDSTTARARLVTAQGRTAAFWLFRELDAGRQVLILDPGYVPSGEYGLEVDFDGRVIRAQVRIAQG
jgi:hypothetical protein